MAERDGGMRVAADHLDGDWSKEDLEADGHWNRTSLPGRQSLRYRHQQSVEGMSLDRDPGVCSGTPEVEGWALDGSCSPALAALPMFKKRLLRQVRSEESGSISSWQMWMSSRYHSLRQFHSEARNALDYVKLWRSSLHQIEGHFGTGIGSYFSFLRFLLLLNICTFLLIASFVVVPVIIRERFGTQHVVPATASPVQAANCTQYDRTDLGLVNFYDYGMNILSGTGLLEHSYLFYGFYPPENVEVSGYIYNTSLAYLLTAISYYLMAFCWIVHRSVMGFKHSQLHGDGTLSIYSNKVFTGWDFCITQESAVRLKQNSIRYELQMDIQETFMRQAIAGRTKWQRFRIYITRLLVNLLILAVLGAAFYAIYQSTEFSQANSTEPGVAGLLLQYLPSMVITAANLITPLIFNQLVTLEQYSPETEIQLSLLRSVFLKLASLGVLLYSLWRQITCDGDMISAANCQLCGYNYKQYQCWEIKIGQEMYKLMIFDLLIMVATMILVDFPRKMFVQYSGNRLAQLWGEQEFLVPQNVLEIVYGQTVCWIGSFFSPFLPLLNAVKYILIFYLKE
ncbi:transmembrane channel-like protein 7, partial [Carcharodon carcharias]|uniref:transmembrane channel-like protein 7 n=1 Tax=Carcharodon carcharias TaxID=13397 RepID=UPI001B7E2B45